jgi:hypothetical protein
MDLSSYYKKQEQLIDDRLSVLDSNGDIKRFLEDLPKLTEYANKLLRKHNCSNLYEANDLIHETYIAFIESGESYFIDKFRLCIAKVMHEEKQYYHRMHNWGDYDLLVKMLSNQKRYAQDLVCRQCNEVLNINGFVKSERSKGGYQALCISCYSVKNKENCKAYYGEKKEDEHLKKLRAKACKKYINKPQVKEQHKQRMNEYNKFQKENATDIYIKQLLRGKGFITSQITDDMIKAERERVLRLRRQAA